MPGARRGRILLAQSAPAAHHPRHHYRLAKALADAGYDVATLAPPDLTAGHVDAVPVEYLPVPRGRLRRMASGPRTVLAAARRRPAAVQVLSLDLLPWAVALKLTRRCPVLYDSNEEYDTMMLIKEWLPPRLRPLLQRLVRWLEPLLARQLDGATTALPATQEKFSAAGVRSVLVRNFPPALLFEAVRRGPEFPYDILFGGSLPEDQVPMLVETAMGVAARSSRPVRWLVVARNYGERDKRSLDDALRRAGVRDAFELRFNLPFTEMKRLIGSSRIGFLPYPGDPNYGARIPLRIFEYMACGLPFVASDLPTTAMFTEGLGVADLMAPEPEAFAAALVALLGDPGRQQRMSLAGPKVARERYNWETESRKLIALYAELLGPA